jgi:hypothetical protein
MSFFYYQTGPQGPEQPKGSSVKFERDGLTINGNDLIKVVADNPEIKEGRVDKGFGPTGYWVPGNYNPETGEIV